jgi:hypothetical protein
MRILANIVEIYDELVLGDEIFLGELVYRGAELLRLSGKAD